MHKSLEELFKKFSRVVVAWQEALSKENFERAAFLSNDMCELAAKLRRATFLLHDEELKNERSKHPPK